MWTTAPAVVLVTLAIATLLACLVTTLLVGKKKGRTKVRVTLFGQGFTFTVEHASSTEEEGEEPRPDINVPNRVDEKARGWVRRLTRRKT